MSTVYRSGYSPRPTKRKQSISSMVRSPLGACPIWPSRSWTGCVGQDLVGVAGQPGLGLQLQRTTSEEDGWVEGGRYTAEGAQGEHERLEDLGVRPIGAGGDAPIMTGQGMLGRVAASDAHVES